MIDIKEKEKCCGCTSCAGSCPQGAIRMVVDIEGFCYPEVDRHLCIQCGICNSACPVVNKPESEAQYMESYVLRAKDKDVLMNSTSGGFVTPLFEWTLENQGVMCGAVYDKEFKVVHKILENRSEGISRFRGSKYVQSELGDCFIKIKKYLEQKKLVCFIGTPCQVNGLKAFLGHHYENLICVDLVCHGTPSPKLWDKYLDYQKNKYRSEIKEINFRNKTYGYHSGTMKIEFQNGRTYYGSSRVDLMLRSFFKEISSRPICYKCPFKDLRRCSDFTLYDCWHASEFVSGLQDDDRGYTNVIVQSERGKEIFEKIKDNYEIYPVDTSRVLELDAPFALKSAVPHARRDEYYLDLDKTPLPEHIQRYIPIHLKDHIIESMKRILYFFGVYGVVKRIFIK